MSDAMVILVDVAHCANHLQGSFIDELQSFTELAYQWRVYLTCFVNVMQFRLEGKLRILVYVVGWCCVVAFVWNWLLVDEYQHPSPTPKLMVSDVNALPNEGSVDLHRSYGRREVSGEDAARVLGGDVKAEPEYRIGSEGYGPHILKALSVQDFELAAQAVNWISMCKTNEDMRDGVEKNLRGSNRISPDKLKEIIEGLDKEMRFCQTVSPEIMRRAPEVAMLALRGGASGIAGKYLEWVQGPVPKEFAAEVLKALVVDANHGDRYAMAQLVYGKHDLSVSPMQRRAYYLALRDASEGPQKELLQHFSAAVSTGLDPTEEAQAQQLAATIKAGFKK